MEELKLCPFCGSGYKEKHKYGCYLSMAINNVIGFTSAWEFPTYSKEALEKAWNTRAECTCKPAIEHHGDLIKTTYPCCGYELKEYKYSPYPEVAFNFCPNCGAKVVE